MRAALVLGATGLVGSRCLRELLARPEFDRVIAAGRRRTDLGASAKLEQRIVDFERLAQGDDSQMRLFHGATDVFCCLGSTQAKAGSKEAFRRIDHDYVLAAARAAAEGGARKLLLVSSIGASSSSSSFYLRVKGELERDLAALPLEEIHFFRPSFLVGARAEHRRGEAISIAVLSGVAPLMLGPLRPYRPVKAERVAQSMVAAALGSARGEKVHIHSF